MLHFYLTCVYWLWLNIVACIDQYENDSEYITRMVKSNQNPININYIKELYTDINSITCLRLLLSIHSMQQIIQIYIENKYKNLYEFFPLTNSTKIREGGANKIDNIKKYLDLFKYEQLNKEDIDCKFDKNFKIKGIDLKSLMDEYYRLKSEKFKEEYRNFILNLPSNVSSSK